MRIGIYDCRWQTYGFTGARAYVYAPRQSILRFLLPWKKVWDGNTRFIWDAQRAHPDFLRSWFEESVRQYESYKTAWSRPS